MKKPKVPPREKKNSKYKIDEALRYAQKNEKVRVFIDIQKKENFNMALDYIEQKADIYDLKQNFSKLNKSRFINEAILFTEKTNSTIFVRYTPFEKMNIAASDFEETDYVIMDEGYGKITEYNFKFKFERINFKKFKLAKIDRKRLEELESYNSLTSGSPCFSAGTQICAKTKNGSKGYKEIQDIVKGDYVLTHKNRWRKVTSTMNHVAANACIVKIEGFKDFTISTLNHRYYTREVIINKETNEVTYGDYEWRQLSKFENYETAKETHRTHVCCPIKIFNTFARNNFSNWWRDGNLALVPCESITPIQDDKMVVYNLSVKDDESYVADGCIVHNCTYIKGD